MPDVACYCTCWTCESSEGHCGNRDLHEPRIQVPACDKCSVGVMDMENPHRLGLCKCECHEAQK